jgi:hypothetical protein
MTPVRDVVAVIDASLPRAPQGMVVMSAEQYEILRAAALITTMHAAPGDTLVIEYPNPLSPEQHQMIAERMKPLLDSTGTKLLVADGGMRVSVLKKEKVVG